MSTFLGRCSWKWSGCDPGPVSEQHRFWLVAEKPLGYVILSLPAGNYAIDWIEPATGTVIRSQHLTHKGGTRAFPAPTYTFDIALRIKRG